ncbi:hypothetical protein ELZ30_08275 [Enterococcus faecium]|nr:hypothetical protein DPR13_12735 [Enterococcus faecium]EGP5107856.1 hypothetical protein [Enterococcus faecium]EGP5147780.1 hypothetical protein [Enterococcus faecium]EGP5195803.1 hypothetical protein [Enterococcus faecium]EGP5244876.1 hypothetical protein [Enterococcus faecium]
MFFDVINQLVQIFKHVYLPPCLHFYHIIKESQLLDESGTNLVGYRKICMDLKKNLKQRFVTDNW